MKENAVQCSSMAFATLPLPYHDDHRWVLLQRDSASGDFLQLRNSATVPQHADSTDLLLRYRVSWCSRFHWNSYWNHSSCERVSIAYWQWEHNYRLHSNFLSFLRFKRGRWALERPKMRMSSECGDAAANLVQSLRCCNFKPKHIQFSKTHTVNTSGPTMRTVFIVFRTSCKRLNTRCSARTHSEFEAYSDLSKLRFSKPGF